MIEVAILYILTKYDATIYRVAKIVDELFFAYLKASTGTINPAIKRLQAAGLVECKDKMTEGGLFSKTYSITTEGRKYLKNALLTFESRNPFHVINDAKIALFCSEILEKEEYNEFKNNMLNYLEFYKINLDKGLKNEYIVLSSAQKTNVELTKKHLEELIEIL